MALTITPNTDDDAHGSSSSSGDLNTHNASQQQQQQHPAQHHVQQGPTTRIAMVSPRVSGILSVKDALTYLEQEGEQEPEEVGEQTVSSLQPWNHETASRCLQSLAHHLNQDLAHHHHDTSSSSTNGNDTAATEILDRHGILTLCHTLQTFRSIRILQVHGCAVLLALTQHHANVVLDSQVAVDALLSAIQAHKNCNPLQRLALQALLNVSHELDCWFQLETHGWMDFVQEVVYNTQDATAADCGIAILTNVLKFANM
uniref:Uncharacterized protein n=1 Tax=Entomoneis paludosa TaxID=265537 RepID=A0A7S2YSG8_9STRA|mmetsp:Transcript_793/g.1906  ORF Transcript_793/g.1906 Transcript_793/m.1906 type:complete len:258 (+) Transcript_793:343-1116(+)|eukprot:CAMPEP_0172458292 /NCGR_PEP_ID=MMETSP1065-20121228/26941_1 /TAXON_ID=265537 /ORGANISM="Amphiprora paludosa, Strain CCMP125" /LENGTH=257 /DNA_ID=CAMNT_0013212483 /DNA_START=262 /DNA_END=1035 /DNA_ORIENTATION=+